MVIALSSNGNSPGNDFGSLSSVGILDEASSLESRPPDRGVVSLVGDSDVSSTGVATPPDGETGSAE